MNDSRRARLIGEIEEAFSSNALPGPSEIMPEELLYDPERQDALDAFAGRTWQELSIQELHDHEIILSCFSTRAFAYYLPSFLMAILEDVKAADTLFGAIFYYLNPVSGSPAEKRNARIEAMSLAQREAVVHFAEYLRDAMPEAFNHNEADEVIRLFERHL